MAVRFDAAGDRVSYVGGAGDPPSATFTVTLWVYLTAIDPGAAISIYRRYTSGGSGRGQIGSGGTADPTVTWWPPGRSFGHDLTAGQWSRVAIVVSGGTATSYAAPAVGATVTASGSSGTITAANLITLAGVSAGNGDEWLNGRLTYVRTWAAALSQGEIEDEWASPTPVRTDDLWADWPLEVHTDLTDHSGNNRNLTAGATATTTEDSPPLTVDTAGTATGSGGGSGSATGVREVAATALGAGGGTGTATGVRERGGTAAGSGGGAGAATGEQEINQPGTGSGSGGGSGTATGVRGLVGAADGAGGGTGAAVGVRGRVGTATGSGGGTGQIVVVSEVTRGGSRVLVRTGPSATAAARTSATASPMTRTTSTARGGT